MDRNPINSNNPAQSLIENERFRLVPEEQAVGGPFEGESPRDLKAGVDRCVACNIYKRVGLKDSYFMRVTLRSKTPGRSDILRQANMEVDRYSNDTDLAKVAYVMGGNLAIDDMEKVPGVIWDVGYVAQEAVDEFYAFMKTLRAQE